MTDKAKKRFTLITNEREPETDYNYKNERMRSYYTNPLKIHGETLKEELMRFTNGEGGRRFTVEDLLRGC